MTMLFGRCKTRIPPGKAHSATGVGLSRALHKQYLATHFESELEGGVVVA